MRRFLFVLALAGLSGSVPGPGAAGDGARLHLRATGDVRALERAGDSLWIGTTGGLFVYDLARDMFVDTMTAGDPLPSSAIRAIRAKNDSVLVGTDGGLVVFSGDGVSIHTPRHAAGYDSVPFRDIRSIDVGLAGQIFLGTHGHGLGVMEQSRNYTITRQDSLLDNKVFGAVQEDDTTYYYATAMGLCAWRDSVWVNFQAGAGIPRGEVRAVVPAGGNRYFLLVWNRGVYRFDGEVARRVSREDIFPEDAIAAITVDARGNLWAAGRFGGIAVFQDGHWTKIAESDASVWREPWRCAAADDDGGVYFGSADGVVVAVLDSRVRRIEVPWDLPSGRVATIVADGSGTVFFLNAGNVNRIDRQGGRAVAEPLPGTAFDLAVAPGGGLWAAGRWGVFRLDGQGFVEFPVDIDEPDPTFVSLRFDEVGNLWVATRRGRIYRFDGVVWMRMGRPPGTGLASVDHILSAGDGAVWAFDYGDAQGGAARWNAGRWTSFGAAIFDAEPIVEALRAPNGTVVALTSRHVWGFDEATGKWRQVGAPSEDDSTFVVLSSPPGEPFGCGAFDPEGRLVVGTESRIGLLKDGKWDWYRLESGLPGLNPASLLVPSDDAIWVGFSRDGLALLEAKSVW